MDWDQENFRTGSTPWALYHASLLLGSAQEVAHVVYIGVWVGGACQVVSGWINVNHVTQPVKCMPDMSILASSSSL